jgi:chorismate mutase/prephenate dehydratase
MLYGNHIIICSAKKKEKEMNESIKLKVIFLGPFFTFSHEAAIRLFPKAQFFYDVNPKTIFQKVESEEMDYGIFPVENSATGLIPEFYPLLLDQDFKLFSKEVNVRVVKELYLPIYHHLLARADMLITEIRTLYTHRQPYLQ